MSEGFDETVMPSARAARAKERRMLAPLPVYVAIAGVLSAAILAIIAFA